jgi:hypothetical protein
LVAAMSDFSQGPGWWQASDGKWYPPQAHPGQPYSPQLYPPVHGYQPYPPQAFPAVPPQTPEAPKKFYQQVWFWVLAAVVVVLGSCVSVDTAETTVFNQVFNSRHTIVYTVTGSGTANITFVLYASVDNGAASGDDVALPWTKTVTGQGIIGTYNVGATLVTGTSISCRITIDGNQVASESSTGIGTSVDCTANW